MNIIIAGSRDFENYQVMHDVLYPLFDRFGLLIPGETTIVSGTAKGADRLGERFAKDNELNCIKMPADWDRFGKGAGYRRNAEMAEIADIVICFTNGSKGTQHMINIAKEKELTLIVYDFEGEMKEVYNVHEDL